MEGSEGRLEGRLGRMVEDKKTGRKIWSQRGKIRLGGQEVKVGRQQRRVGRQGGRVGRQGRRVGS